MQIRLLTFGVWLLVAAAATFWGLRVFVPGAPLPEQAQLPLRAPALGGDLQRLFGVAETDDEEAPADASDRFHLLGVVAAKDNEQSPAGVALISVSGQPAKAWRTGAVIDGDTVLLSVSRRSVELGPRGGPPSMELTLPEPVRSATPVANGVAPRGLVGATGQVPARPGVGITAPGMRAGQPAQQQAGQTEDDDEE